MSGTWAVPVNRIGGGRQSAASACSLAGTGAGTAAVRRRSAGLLRPTYSQDGGRKASTSEAPEVSTSSDGTAGEPVVESRMKSTDVANVASCPMTSGQRRLPLRNQK